MKNTISTFQSDYKFIILTLFWSLLVYLSFYFNNRGFEEHSIRLATNQANNYWNKDSAFRAWSSRHGGVYVPPDKRTPPNPLLAHLPHRDIETKDGVKLTLMNPAYMMRQMTEEFDELYGVKGRITGQVLLDPKGQRNKPDAWELESLKQFDLGKTEVIKITQIKGEPYLRMMRPVIMKQGCVLCHGHLGFKEGDIRGGVSVSVPLKPFEVANNSSRKQAIISHVVIWLIGLVVLVYISIIRERQKQNEKNANDIVTRSQKMDALGKLTGGIAHDYNNMLGVILGYAEMLETSLKEQPKLADYAHEIFHAGERGAKLTKKLLAFSKKTANEQDELNLNTLLLNEKLMLEKTLTARIKLEFKLQENLWPVYLDESDMEDAILNLCINAMHAIEGNGQLIMQTRNQYLNTPEAKSLGLTSGDYVSLSITDTGCGMNETTMDKIFEPFFTTKGSRGTGLGLSQVYGFVNRSGGVIKVNSELNHGCCFTLYFPRYHATEQSNKISEEVSTPILANNKKILVVDDEKALLYITSEILTKNGFNVFTAESAKQALELLQQEQIDILISDIIMPEMDGYQLAAKVKEKHPHIKIQLVSGFTENQNIDMIDNELKENILHKPVNAHTLLQRIQFLMS